MELLPVLAILGVAVGGLAQSVTGLGFALVAAPGLIALLGPTHGVSQAVLLGTLACILPLVRQWRHVRVRDGVTLLVPILVATPIVAALIADADTGALAVAAGIAVLIGVAALWRGLSWAPLHSMPGTIATGVASATMNVIGGVGGPPIGIHAANAGWPPDEVRGTLQAIFLVQGLATIAAIGLARPSPWMLLALAVGTLAGMRLAPLIPTAAARHAVLAVAAFGGIGLIVANI